MMLMIIVHQCVKYIISGIIGIEMLTMKYDW